MKGVITVKDVATANMDGMDPHALETAKTSYQNLIDILEGTVLVGDVTGKTVEGRIIIGSGSAEQIEASISPGDVVVVSNRAESQLAALEMDAGCIIVCASSKVSRTMQMLAEEKGCIVIITQNSTYVTGQMLSQAAPIRHYMTTGNGHILYGNDPFQIILPIHNTQGVQFLVPHGHPGPAQTHLSVHPRRRASQWKIRQSTPGRLK